MKIKVTRNRTRLSKAFANHDLDEIRKLKGIELVEERDPNKDYFYKCANYVFGKLLKEVWGYAPSLIYTDHPLWSNTDKFLSEKGYRKVRSMEEETLVFYAGIDSRYKKYIGQHVGLYRKGKVLSKFSSWCIFEHDIEMVPEIFGNDVSFYRK